MACLRWHPVSATNSSRIFCFSLLDAPQYLAPTAWINSLRVVMLIRPCFVTSRSRRTIRQVANYLRQQGISGNISDELMRAAKIVDAGHSFRLNDEATLNIVDTEFAAQQTRIFADDLTQSRKVSLSEWRERPLHERLTERVASLFGSQL